MDQQEHVQPLKLKQDGWQGDWCGSNGKSWKVVGKGSIRERDLMHAEWQEGRYQCVDTF